MSTGTEPMGLTKEDEQRTRLVGCSNILDFMIMICRFMIMIWWLCIHRIDTIECGIRCW